MPQIKTKNSPAAIVDHFFRHESSRVIALLVNYFGTEHFEKVEDAVQDAMVKAMTVWAYKGTPDNPSAWILRVAKNGLLDQVRRNKNFSEKEKSIVAEIETISNPKEPLLDDALNDGLLKMLFACCHAAIPQESQIILSLKVLCGFSNQEIAKALLKNEAAVAKSYTRAKAKLQLNVKELDVPSGADLNNSLQTVLRTIYLLYNEGYNAAHGEVLIKKDVCAEAMRLAMLLLKHPNIPKVEIHALLALMCFQASRFDARVTIDGELITLESQDRKLWEKELIIQGRYHLELASEIKGASEYLLQASIAACHCFAKSFNETNWERILFLYDHLLKINPSNIIKLNRAVALAKATSPRLGLKAIQEIEETTPPFNYYLLYAVKAQLLFETGKPKKSIEHYYKALALTKNEPERKYIQYKIDHLLSINQS